jgi:hypothetical protein
MLPMNHPCHRAFHYLSRKVPIVVMVSIVFADSFGRLTMDRNIVPAKEYNSQIVEAVMSQ